MKIAAGVREQEAADGRQDRVPEIAVQKRHGAGRDAAPEAVSHDEVVSVAKLLDEGHQGREVVAVVRVAHDDELAGCRLDAAHEGAPVAFLLHVDDTRPESFRDLDRAVRAAVVGDDDLAFEIVLAERSSRLRDTRLEGLRFVETGHYDRELELPAGVITNFRHVRIFYWI